MPHASLLRSKRRRAKGEGRRTLRPSSFAHRPSSYSAAVSSALACSSSTGGLSCHFTWFRATSSIATRVGLAFRDLILGFPPWMSCSARLDTSNTYRERPSMPSGKPSISFLLEPLGHPGDGLERRLGL